MGDVPTIEGPVTGGARGWAFGSSMSDVTAAGYEEHEWFLSGHATRYRETGGYAFDGRWTAEPVDAVPYRTRVLVRRPVDRPAGVVLVGWSNVSPGYEGTADLTDEVVALGAAQVLVSVQRVAVHGFGGDVSFGLDTWDTERYGTLDHPGDDFSYDIFTQAAAAARQLAGADGALLVAFGASQSAYRLTTYHNAIQPLTHAFDGYLLDVNFGGGTLLDATDESHPLLDFGPMTRVMNALASPTHFRDDLGLPVLVLNSETEALTYAPSRQPDTAIVRLWEVAGTAHAAYDRWLVSEPRVQRDFGSSPSVLVPPAHRNTVPMEPVREAALHHLYAWLTEGTVPTAQPRFPITDGVLPRDALGNAVGAIRIPDLAVPVGVHVGQPANGWDLFGSTTPLPVETLRDLYRDAAGYLRRYEAATEMAVANDVVLPRDAERLCADAAARAAALFG